MIQQTPFVRRQVRKLLLFICGSKEKYRQLRDLHTLDSHMRGIKKLLEEQGIFLRGGIVTATSGSALQYDTLISLVSNRLAWEFTSLIFILFSLYFVTGFLFFLQMEHLKACAEIATQRTVNWQKFCMKDDCKCTISVVYYHLWLISDDGNFIEKSFYDSNPKWTNCPKERVS